MKILNGIKLIRDDQGNHLDSYTISLESFRSFRGPLFRKPVNGQELFLAVSYSKPTLAIKVSWLKALLCSMSTVQSYLTSEAFLLAFQPVYAVRIRERS